MVLQKPNWKSRVELLCKANIELIKRINQSKIISNVKVNPSFFFNRLKKTILYEDI